MEHSIKEKYKFWGIGIVICLIFMCISKLSSKPDPNDLKTISVNAPKSMHSAFEQTLKALKVDDEYRIEFTDDASANFVVNEGLKADGKLIAFSPFIAVFNSDENLYDKMVEEEIFVPSESDSNFEDFDFKKIMEQTLSSSGSNFKVYYPAKNSDSWEEFYSFLLFTANDGYYPKPGINMEETQKYVEDFLNSKNIEPITANSLERINTVPQNSIYFISYADLAYLYKTSGISKIIVMYPKTVVYHNYYASFDETGKILYDFLSKPISTFSYSSDHVGYDKLDSNYFNTSFTSGTYRFTSSQTNYNDIKQRNSYNAVEIPDVTVNNDSSKEVNYEN